jgi:hypothetical protein
MRAWNGILLATNHDFELDSLQVFVSRLPFARWIEVEESSKE